MPAESLPEHNPCKGCTFNRDTYIATFKGPPDYGLHALGDNAHSKIDQYIQIAIAKKYMESQFPHLTPEFKSRISDIIHWKLNEIIHLLPAKTLCGIRLYGEGKCLKTQKFNQYGEYIKKILDVSRGNIALFNTLFNLWWDMSDSDLKLN